MNSERVYQVTSGAGPAECERAVAHFAQFAERMGCIPLQFFAGMKKGTYRSALLALPADDEKQADPLAEFAGTVLWVCKSPYRPDHKRKNWFIGVSCLTVSDDAPFDERLVAFDTFRSGGHGGQNVNKVETGVRGVYRDPLSGKSFTAVCTRERSQLANRREAVRRLRLLAAAMAEETRAQDKKDAWREHSRLERGKAVATFAGENFVRVL